MALRLVGETEMSEDVEHVNDGQYYSSIARVPSEDEFAETEFIESAELGNIVNRLIQRHNMPARNFDVLVLWKSKGGRSSGRPVWGKTQKLAGVARYLSEQADFVIWISADHVRNERITNYQLEAIVFHELNHISASEDEEGNVSGFIKAHDFEGFYKDIEVYGNWADTYRGVEKSMKQAPLIVDGYIRVGVYEDVD